MDKTNKNDFEFVIDQASQLLNLKQNNDTDYRKTTYLFDVYHEILKGSVNNEFLLSLKQSESCHLNDTLDYSKELNQLVKNNPNSFLISPLASNSHFFNVLVRNTTEGYSATIVNRGPRDAAPPFMEFMFNDLNKLNKTLSDNHFYSEDLDKSIRDIYKSFKQNSDEESKPYRLSVLSSSQKTGNCIVKEPETAIRFAFSTMNFASSDLQKLRKSGTEFRPKWNITALQMHKKYIETLIERHPPLKDKLTTIWDVYVNSKIKKHPRQYKNTLGIALNYKLHTSNDKMDIDSKDHAVKRRFDAVSNTNDAKSSKKARREKEF